MDNTVIIGIGIVAFWIATFWFYFRSSNAQDALHEQIDTLNRSLDAREKE